MIKVIITPNLQDEGGEAIANLNTFEFHAESGVFSGAALSFELTRLSTSLATNSPRILIPADIDNDGDLDLIGGDDNPGTLFYFENVGSGNYSEGVVIDDNNGYFDVKVTDFDLDGDLDIVTADRSVSQGVYWYENDGSASFTEHLIVSLPNSDSRSLSVADFNKDGNLDVAVASFGSNRFHAFDRDGNQLFAAANASNPIFIADLDWNNDGIMDVVAANYGGSVVRWTAAGNGAFSSTLLHSVSQARCVVPFDIDQDGDTDIIYSAQSASQIGVLENDGAGNFINVQVGSVGGPHRVDVGDVDGDGDYDIVYTVAGGSSDINFYYLENSGSLTLWVPKKLMDSEAFSGTFTQTARFADIDNDGDLDVLATDASTSFYIFENKIVDLNEAPIVANTVADQTIEEDATTGLTIDVSNVFTDNDGDDFTLSVSSDTDAVTVSLDGDELEINVATADFNGDANVTLTADDGNGTNSDVFIVTVTAVNDAPIFDLSLASIEVDEDFTTTEIITVTQNQPPNEDEPVYSISPTSVSFANVSIDGTTGEIVITAVPDEFGAQEFTITADDGASENSTATQTFMLTVNAVNDAPAVTNEIADVSLEEDPLINGRVVLTNIFSDADEDELLYSLDVTSGADLANIALDESTINIAPAANAFGTIEVVVTAEDPSGAAATDTFEIIINAVNDAPTFMVDRAGITVTKNFTETQTVTVSANAVPFGEDSQVVTYSLSPSSVTFANVTIDGSTGEVSITSIADQFGAQEFTIIADDGQLENNTATGIFTLEVLDNLAPEVIATVPNTAMDEDQATLDIVDVSTLFSDPENDPMTYSVSDDFEGAVSVALNGDLLQVTPTADFNGSGTITIAASDAGQTTSTSFTLTVNSINDVPTLTGSVENQQAMEDQAFTYFLPSELFADVDGDAVEVSVGTLPTWLVYSEGGFTGTPENGDVGTSAIEVVGDDGNGGTATVTFDLEVTNVNDAPTVINAVDDLAVDEDAPEATVDISNVFEDVDAGDQVAIESVSSNTDLVTAAIDAGTLSLNFLLDASGTATITLTASDNDGETVSDEFTVTVNSVNDAPVFTLSDTEISEEADFSGVISIELLAGDIPLDEADQTVNYTITSDGPEVVNATVNGTFIELSSIAEASGEQTFTVTADDGQVENNTHTVTFTVTIEQVLSADNLQDEVLVYPNPVVNTLLFDRTNMLEVVVISSDGRICIRENVSGSLNVESLEAGVYLVQINDGLKVTTHRIIKKN